MLFPSVALILEHMRDALAVLPEKSPGGFVVVVF